MTRQQAELFQHFACGGSVTGKIGILVMPENPNEAVLGEWASCPRTVRVGLEPIRRTAVMLVQGVGQRDQHIDIEQKGHSHLLLLEQLTHQGTGDNCVSGVVNQRNPAGADPIMRRKTRGSIG